MARLEEESYEKSLNDESSKESFNEASSEECFDHLLLSDSGTKTTSSPGSSRLREAILDPRSEKKRKTDQAYRKHKKETLRKFKEEQRKVEPQTYKEDPELKILHREVNRLQAENKLLQHIADKLQKVPRVYKAIFEMKFSNDEAKEIAIKKVSELPGITNVKQDLKNKALVVRGAMDILDVQKILENFGDTNLVSYDADTTKKDGPAEDKKGKIPLDHHPKMEPAETTKKEDKKEHASRSKSPDAPIPKKA